MFRKSLVLCVSLALAAVLAPAADTAPSGAMLSAVQIVEKNVAARGGLSAWHAVQTMSMEGKMGAGGNQRSTLPAPIPGQVGRKGVARTLPQRSAEEAQLPFLMELKRPRKVRMELQFKGQTAVQAYDGMNGWKLRPFLNRSDVEPYTADELKMAAMQQELDGPLVDYALKGTKVELVGSEKVEDRDTYKLKLTMSNGRTNHVWIDAGTFLEAKIEGQPRLFDGVAHPVEVYFRDYRSVSGLQVPYILETKVLPADRTVGKIQAAPIPAEKIIIDKVVINPKLEDSLFSRAGIGPIAHGK